MNDLISRKAAIDAIMDADVCVTWNGVISDDDAVDIAIKSTKGSVISSIVNMPSAQPDSKELSFTQKKLDTISRQAAIRWVKTECNPYGKPTLDFESGKKVIEHLKQMPSAQPEQTNSWYINSWCIDCKEYDTENKCCPRYNRVIKQTLDDAYRHGETEAEARFYAEIVRCKDCVHYDTGFPYDRCLITDKYAEEDDFCSWAERRTDD